MWLFIVWLLPATLLTVAGVFGGSWGAGLGLAFIWIGTCIFKGSVTVQEQGFIVIERLGKFHTVYFPGWHVRVIGVDRIRTTGDLTVKRLQLYADEQAPEIDFEDGSASLDASIWYQIGNPDDIKSGNWKKVADSVKSWVYTYAKPEEKIYNLVDGELRPRLQSKKIDEASTDRNGIADAVMGVVDPEMALFGAYVPAGGKRLIIEDIDLPPQVVALRELVLEGQKKAQESENLAGGYWKSIKAIQDGLSISTEEAIAIYNNQQGLRTLEAIKPAMTLVGKDLSGVIGTISLGNK